ncbi:MAG: FGGY-family carbohydrate kinase [Myxococcaceae bacterium]
MATPHLLAIDLGTSGPKVALFTSSGDWVDADFEPVALQLGEGGAAEQSPDEWWRAVTVAAQRLKQRQSLAMSQVVGVGCTAQWSGTVPIDEAGHPLGNAIIWMDTRGASQVKRQVRGFPSLLGYGALKLAKWVRLTGGAPGFSGKDSLAHILFLKAERPEVYARTRYFLEPKDYLNLRLSGAVHASYDSIVLHWVTDNRNPSAVSYSPSLMRLAGLSGEQLPSLRRATDVIGQVKPDVAAALGIPESAKVVCGTPDVHSAALGSGAVADFTPHLYLGTSSWLTCHVPFKKTDALHNMATIVSPMPGRYLIGNEQECAGACLTFLRDNVFFSDDGLGTGRAPDDVFQRFDQLAAAIPAGAGKVLFTPWLYGERTPIEDPWIRGGFHNVSLDTPRGALVRAVLEGVAFNARWLLQTVEKFAGRPMPFVHIIGGGAKSPLWCEIQANVLGRTVNQVSRPMYANARGAAMLTAVGLGLGTFQDWASRCPIERVFEPDSKHQALYSDLFGEFVRLYQSHRAIHRRLNQAP